MKVGSWGLVCAAIAANILKAGHDLVVWNRSLGRASRLSERRRAGVNACERPPRGGRSS